MVTAAAAPRPAAHQLHCRMRGRCVIVQRPLALQRCCSYNIHSVLDARIGCSQTCNSRMQLCRNTGTATCNDILLHMCCKDKQSERFISRSRYASICVSHTAVRQLLQGPCLLQRVAVQHRCRVTASSATQADVPAELSKIVSGFQMVHRPAECRHHVFLKSEAHEPLYACLTGA